MLRRKAWLHSDVCECHIGPRRATALTAVLVPRGSASPLLSFLSQESRCTTVLVVAHRHSSTSLAQVSLCSWWFSAITLQRLLHTYLQATENHTLPLLSQSSQQMKSLWSPGTTASAWLDLWSSSVSVSSESLPALTQQYREGLYHIFLHSLLCCEREEVFCRTDEAEKHCPQIRYA